MTQLELKQAHLPKDKNWTGGSSGKAEVGTVAREVFGVLEPGSALMYFIRRFGYTRTGSDDDKEVCAYRLNTSDPDVFIDVSFRGWGVEFFPIIPEALRNAANGTWDIEKNLMVRDLAVIERIHKAARATFENLLLPTYVRDVAIGIHGKIADADLICVPDPEDPEEETVLSVEHHVSAGYGVPTEWLEDPQAFWARRVLEPEAQLAALAAELARAQAGAQAVAGLAGGLGEQLELLDLLVSRQPYSQNKLNLLEVSERLEGLHKRIAALAQASAEGAGAGEVAG